MCSLLPFGLFQTGYRTYVSDLSLTISKPEMLPLVQFHFHPHKAPKALHQIPLLVPSGNSPFSSEIL